jgi:hypothetical protein
MASDDDEVQLLEIKLPKAQTDWPHNHKDCKIRAVDDQASFCSQCFCWVCDTPVAQCTAWASHCAAVPGCATWDALRVQKKNGGESSSGPDNPCALPESVLVGELMFSNAWVPGLTQLGDDTRSTHLWGRPENKSARLLFDRDDGEILKSYEAPRTLITLLMHRVDAATCKPSCYKRHVLEFEGLVERSLTEVCEAATKKFPCAPGHRWFCPDRALPRNVLGHRPYLCVYEVRSDHLVLVEFVLEEYSVQIGLSSSEEELDVLARKDVEAAKAVLERASGYGIWGAARPRVDFSVCRLPPPFSVKVRATFDSEEERQHEEASANLFPDGDDEASIAAHEAARRRRAFLTRKRAAARMGAMWAGALADECFAHGPPREDVELLGALARGLARRRLAAANKMWETLGDATRFFTHGFNPELLVRSRGPYHWNALRGVLTRRDATSLDVRVAIYAVIPDEARACGKGVPCAPSALLLNSARELLEELRLRKLGWAAAMEEELERHRACDLPLLADMEALLRLSEQALPHLPTLEGGGPLDLEMDELAPVMNATQQRVLRTMLAAECGSAACWTELAPGLHLSSDGRVLLRGEPGDLGGILALPMGEGKSLLCMALVAATRDGQVAGDTLRRSLPALRAPLPTERVLERGPRRPRRSQTWSGTLLVVPGNLVNQWVQEKQYFPALSMLNLYPPGADKNLSADQLAGYDLVVTSPAKLAGASQAVLRAATWRRVIFDEAHKLTGEGVHVPERASQAVLCRRELKASSRWCISGTPLDGDFVNQLAFLRASRVSPLVTQLRPSKPARLPWPLVRALRALVIRSAKGTADGKGARTKVVFREVMVALTARDARSHVALARMKLATETTAAAASTHVWREFVNWLAGVSVVYGDANRSLAADSHKAEVLPAKLCSACGGTEVAAVRYLPCAHAVCLPCAGAGVTCTPACPPVTNLAAVQNTVRLEVLPGCEAKLSAVLAQARDDLGERGAQIVMVAPTESAAGSVAKYLRERGLPVVRFAGNRSIEKFQSGTVRILVTHDAKGLNVPEANHVYILSPPLTGGELDQAVGRVDRLSQHRSTVTATTFVCAGSLEAEVVSLMGRSRERKVTLTAVFVKKFMEDLVAAALPAPLPSEEASGGGAAGPSGPPKKRLKKWFLNSASSSSSSSSSSSDEEMEDQKGGGDDSDSGSSYF